MMVAYADPPYLGCCGLYDHFHLDGRCWDDVETHQVLILSEYEVLEAMTRFGGSFVKQLAVLIRLADYTNKRKLLAAFPEYIEEYRELARLSAVGEPGGGDDQP